MILWQNFFQFFIICGFGDLRFFGCVHCDLIRISEVQVEAITRQSVWHSIGGGWRRDYAGQGCENWEERGRFATGGEAEEEGPPRVVDGVQGH